MIPPLSQKDPASRQATTPNWEKQQVGPAQSEVTLRGGKATPKVQEQE